MKINKEQKYIVRGVEAGVFYGYITEKEGCEVTMKNARCLWYWEGASSAGINLLKITTSNLTS